MTNILEAKTKEEKKELRKKLKKEKQRKEQYERDLNQPPVKYIEISIEWKKSRTWGFCPRATGHVRHQNGNYSEFSAYASGCGYDKESTVIADILNQCLKYALFGKKDLPYAATLTEFGGLPYAYFNGGCGMECYYPLLTALGFTLKKTAWGSSYDHYTITKNETIH